MAEWVCGSCNGANPEGTRFCGNCGAKAPDSSPSPEERRLITALFADISGFTPLADRLDPEELLEVIDPIVSALSSIVGRYEGFVEKFAGDALLALFGAPVSHDDDAARALLVALEMHAELDRIKAQLPPDARDLTLHVGVNSGHGIARMIGSEARTDYAVLGDAVILAQRLESAAPPGETYVSEMTVRLTDSEFAFEPVGELTLKGKAEPVPAWRLVGERDGRPQRSALIGRDSELHIVEKTVSDLGAGSGGLVVITGEAGIGKSRLIEAAIDRAATLGARVHHARCISYGAGVPYWPYVDLLRRTAGLRNDEQPDATRLRLEAVLSDADACNAAPYFARLLGLPVADEEVSDLEPEAFRRGLHDAFESWFQRQTDTSPVVLVLEDLHWADASTVGLTAELADLAQEAQLLIVLTGRPEAEENVRSIVADADPRRIELGPLGHVGIGQLAEAILGSAPPDTLLAFVERRTSGNPFFVEELVRALRDGGALVPEENGWTIRAGWDERQLPPTVEGVLTARMDLLPRETASLLQTASVVGRRVRVPLLEAVVGQDGLAERLDELVRGGFLERAHENAEPVVVFHHALLQDAAYARLLRRRRRELHLRVAEVAEALYGSGDHVIDLLARHLYLGESPAAAAYLVRAGERATRLYANEEAILHLRRATELRPDDAEIRLALADLYELVGDYEQSLRLYEQIRTQWNDLRAWRGMASSHRKRGEYAAALAIVDEAFRSESLRDEDLTSLWFEQGATLSAEGRFDNAIDVLLAGFTAVDGRRDAEVGQLLVPLARAELLAGRLDDALEHAMLAQAILEAQGDARSLCSAARVLGDVYTTLGTLDEASEMLRRGLALAERVGNVEEIGACLLNLGNVELARGAVAESMACSLRAVEEFERIGHGSGRAIGYSNVAWTLAQQGDYDEAERYCKKAIDVSRSIGHLLVAAETTDTLAFIGLRQGSPIEAAARAEEAAELFIELGAMPKAAGSLKLATEAWEQAGELERALDARSRARSLA